ncbi:MAG: aminotransferase class III-fold pyridoxal phosphate-dependent enzyme [Bacteroidota bacterium]
MDIFPVYPLFDIELTKGEGSWLWDNKGEKYLDFYGGHAVISVGHSHPHYVERIKGQLDQLGFFSNSVKIPLQDQLAEKLGQISGLTDYSLFLCNSGAEANENAFKLASFHNGRKKIISFKNAFHGRTSLAVATTDSQKIKAAVNPDEHVIFLELGDTEGVEKQLKKGDVSAVIIEGIQGIGGIYIPDDDFVRTLRALCDKYEVVLILDEIQSGYGRSGEFFAFQYTDIEPDIITIAKGMGNGFPVGGVLIHPKFEAWYGMLGTTFGGNHLACSAALAVLEVIEQESLVSNSKKMGQYIMEALSEVSSIVSLRGRGLMIGIELEEPVKSLRTKLLQENKVFTGAASNPNTIRLLPPLNIKRDQVDYFLDSFKTAI